MTAQRLSLTDVRLSQSVIHQYMRCPYTFEQATLYQIKPRFTPAPLRRGTLVAEGLSAARMMHFRKPDTSLDGLEAAGHLAMKAKQAEWMKDPAVKPHFTDELALAFSEQFHACVSIFDRALEALGLHEGKWETVTLEGGTPLIEHEMSVSAPGFKEFGGKLDWVCRETATGNVWLWDDKTQKQLAGEEYYETQTQSGAYIHLLKERHGIELVGSINYLIRAAVPKVPKMNKRKSKGQSTPGMSQSDIASTWPIYRQALLDNGLDPADYQEMRAKLDAKTWQRIDRYFRTPKEVAAVWREVQAAGRAILKADGDEATVSNYPRNLNPFNCSGCWLKAYCLADLRGHDTEFLARTEYMREGETPFFPIDIED